MKFWKFRMRGHRKPHLSEGTWTGAKTLCGIEMQERIINPSRTVTKLEGDECIKCAKESEWDEWKPLTPNAKVRSRTFNLGKHKK